MTPGSSARQPLFVLFGYTVYLLSYQELYDEPRALRPSLRGDARPSAWHPLPPPSCGPVLARDRETGRLLAARAGCRDWGPAPRLLLRGAFNDLLEPEVAVKASEAPETGGGRADRVSAARRGPCGLAQVCFSPPPACRRQFKLRPNLDRDWLWVVSASPLRLITADGLGTSQSGRPVRVMKGSGHGLQSPHRSSWPIYRIPGMPALHGGALLRVAM